MHTTKLITILKTFSKKDLRQFKEYVNSPFFNKYEYAKKLQEYIYQSAPSFKNKKIERTKVFKHLFPNKKYNEPLFNNIISDLFTLLEDYLALLDYDSDPVTRKIHLLSTLRKRNMDKNFIRTMNIVKNIQENNPYRDENFYLKEFIIESEADRFFIRKEQRTYNESLQKKADNLDLFYLSTKLKNCCEMINRKNVLAVNFNLDLLNEILLYLEEHPHKFKDVPAIIIYNTILLTLMRPNEVIHFKNLKKLLEEHEDKFSIQEKQGMYQYAQNYCTKKINEGNPVYLEELFSLYKVLLTKEIIFEENHISQGVYKNIVSVGIRLKQFEWTEKFINIYRERIASEFRENAFTYNLAILYYSKHEYGKARKLFQNVEFTDVFYNLGAKSTLLKIYYELDELESFLSLTDSFKIYLRRNKLISDSQYKTNTNFIKFTKKLFALKPQGETARKQKIVILKQIIEQTKDIANVNWLKEMIEKL